MIKTNGLRAGYATSYDLMTEVRHGHPPLVESQTPDTKNFSLELKMSQKRVRFILEGLLATREEITTEQLGDGGQRVITTSQTKPLEAVMTELEKQNPRIDFAPGLNFGRWIASVTKGNKTAVAVELPPGVREFHYRNASPGKEDYATTPGQIFQVGFPYIILIVWFDGTIMERLFVYYSNSPIVTTDQSLCQCNLPNIYTTGWNGKMNDQLCTGAWGIPTNLNMLEKINRIVEEFLAAEYNLDLRSTRWNPATGFASDGSQTGKAKAISNHPKSFEDWQKMSAEDPNFVLKLNWVSAGVTLEQILRKGVE